MWKIKKTERILDSEFVKVDKDDVTLPHGREIKDFYKVTIKDCAAIVAITPDNHIIMKKEYRHCYGEELVEIPAGVLEDGEDPLETAKRELEEETGYVGKKWTYLGKTVESSAKLTNYMYIYLAEDCEKVSGQKLDYGEDIEVIEVSLNEAIEMIMNNEIICNSSIGAILKAARIVIFLNREVDTDEFEAISRKIAEEINIDIFDPTTFQPERLMYWPSTSSDGEFYFHCQEGPFLDPDSILNKYDDWRNMKEWAYPAGEKKRTQEKKAKVADPLTKKGGFCHPPIPLKGL